MFIVSVSVLLLSMVVILVHIWYRFKISFTEKLMALAYLSIIFVYWNIHLNTTGDIIHFPHFYRIGGGVWMLSPVLLFYCARVIYKERFSWNELLILVPLVLYFINFAPFIFQSAEAKIAAIKEVLSSENVYNFSEGWFMSGKLVLGMRVLHKFFCAALIANLIWNRGDDVRVKSGNRKIVKYYFWFVLLSSFPELIYLSEIRALGEFFNPNYMYLILALVFLILYFLSPRLLYGYQVDSYKKNINEDDLLENLNDSEIFQEGGTTDRLGLTLKKRNDLLKIEFCIDNDKPYLDLNFSLKKLEKKLDISSKKISLIIKKKYKLNFQQFINQKRIGFVLNKLEEDKKWRNFSIEALAMNSGFNSTNSFYNYFKVVTGKTPRDYIDLLELNKTLEATKNSDVNNNQEGIA